MKNTIIILFIVICLPSCKVVNALTELPKKKVKVSTMAVDGKTVKFIPMHHLGKKEFYDNVKDKIVYYQKDGYKVYYEMIRYIKKPDSLENDNFFRKVRKFRGSTRNYKEDMDSIGILKKYVQQPSYTKLGVDSTTSVWADLDYRAIISEYEKRYGTIQLDSTDLHTPLNDKSYTSTTFLDGHKIKAIIVNFRNAQLAKVIDSSPDKKILVVFGKGHVKGTKKLLKHYKHHL